MRDRGCEKVREGEREEVGYGDTSVSKGMYMHNIHIRNLMDNFVSPPYISRTY